MTQTTRCPKCSREIRRCICGRPSQMTIKFSKEEMIKWLDELIELEKGSDACFPNMKFDPHTIVKDIREVVLNAKF